MKGGRLRIVPAIKLHSITLRLLNYINWFRLSNIYSLTMSHAIDQVRLIMVVKEAASVNHAGNCVSPKVVNCI